MFVSPWHRGSPGAAASYPRKGWRPQHTSPQVHGVSAQVLHQLLLDSHWDAPHRSGEHPSEQRGQPGAGLCSEQGGRRGTLALHPSSCPVHPTKEGRDRDTPRKVPTDEGARLAAETEPLKPAETLHSCNFQHVSSDHRAQPKPGAAGSEGSAPQTLHKGLQTLPVLRCRPAQGKSTHKRPLHHGCSIWRCSAPRPKPDLQRPGEDRDWF